MSWINFLGNLSNNEMCAIRDKINENDILYPRKFIDAVDRVFNIHLEYNIQGDNNIEDVAEEPDIVWLFANIDDWSKNGIYELLSVVECIYWKNLLNTMIEVKDDYE